MGERGPPARPAKALAPGGNRRRQREKEGPAFEPEPGMPDFPDWIPGAVEAEVRAVWDKIVSEIAPGVLTRCDGDALADLCVFTVRLRRAQKYLLELEDEAMTIKGRLTRLPHAITAEKLAVIVGQLRQQFGLTPASRVRANVLSAETKSERSKEHLFKPSLRIRGA